MDRQKLVTQSRKNSIRSKGLWTDGRFGEGEGEGAGSPV